MSKTLIKKTYNIDKISTSGQIFRFNKINDNAYDLIEKDRRLRIEETSKGYFFYCDKKTYDTYYKFYFDDKSSVYNKITSFSKGDKFLKECLKKGEGLRILNQDRFEMLISFIISQRKSIPAIKTSIEKLCKLCGKKKKDEFGEYYAFPNAKEILDKRSKLSSCSLGYRVEYIIDACEKILSGEINLKNDKMSDEELLSYLMNIKGVGIKVASCVALFSYHRLGICPIDVWIRRVLDKYYKGVVPDKYKKYAGIIQQYWFYNIRGEI